MNKPINDMRLFNYRQIHDELEEVFNWLSNLGIKIENSRIQKYQKVVSYLADMYDTGKLADLDTKNRLPEFINSLYEVHELSGIWSGLKHYKDPILIEKLNKSIYGPLFARSEILNGTNTRDYAFELSVMSNIAKAGYKLNFSDTSDVEAELNGRNIFIECKRPRGKKTIQKNVSKALKQLQRCYQEHPSKNPEGYIAIALDKIVNLDQKLLIARTQSELSQKMQTITDSFIDKYAYLWQSIVSGPTIGVMVVLKAPSIIQDRNLFLVANWVTFNNAREINDKERENITELAEALKINFDTTAEADGQK